MAWPEIQVKLGRNPGKFWSLNEMEELGGEPDVVSLDKNTNKYTFYDCTPESSKECRIICYDAEVLEKRKENKSKNSPVGMVTTMSIMLLNETQYFELQKLGNFDSKISNWIETPTTVREVGGAIFVYHNGAESYNKSRGFRGFLIV